MCCSYCNDCMVKKWGALRALLLILCVHTTRQRLDGIWRISETVRVWRSLFCNIWFLHRFCHRGHAERRHLIAICKTSITPLYHDILTIAGEWNHQFLVDDQCNSISTSWSFQSYIFRACPFITITCAITSKEKVYSMLELRS